MSHLICQRKQSLKMLAVPSTSSFGLAFFLSLSVEKVRDRDGEGKQDDDEEQTLLTFSVKSRFLGAK